MGLTTWDLEKARLISITSFSSSSASNIVVLVMSPMSAIPVLLEACVEGTSVALGLDADAPLHARQPLLDDGEADAGARIGLRGVQPLEHVEYPLAVLRRDADAVVADAQLHDATPRHRPDAHVRDGAGGHELERVADQVQD